MTQQANHPASWGKGAQLSFESVDELAVWLAAKGIDPEAWGDGTTKSIESLWQEIVRGEITLQDDPPLRIVQVVQLIIRKGQSILIEVEQEFEDDRRRARRNPPSEKLEQGESYLEAALRCLQEELGVAPQNVELLPATYTQHCTESDSLSYPGLLSRYLFHTVEARVEGLPETDFWTTESNQERNDPVKRHRWSWQKQSPKDSKGKRL